MSTGHVNHCDQAGLGASREHIYSQHFKRTSRVHISLWLCSLVCPVFLLVMFSYVCSKCLQCVFQCFASLLVVANPLHMVGIASSPCIASYGWYCCAVVQMSMKMGRWPNGLLDLSQHPYSIWVVQRLFNVCSNVCPMFVQCLWNVSSMHDQCLLNICSISIHGWPAFWS